MNCQSLGVFYLSVLAIFNYCRPRMTTIIFKIADCRHMDWQAKKLPLRALYSLSTFRNKTFSQGPRAPFAYSNASRQLGSLLPAK